MVDISKIEEAQKRLQNAVLALTSAREEFHAAQNELSDAVSSHDGQCDISEKLSMRARRAMRRLGIQSLASLAALKSSDVLAVKNVGFATFSELRNALEFAGLRFADE